jgi:hypothetical protein
MFIFLVTAYSRVFRQKVTLLYLFNNFQVSCHKKIHSCVYKCLSLDPVSSRDTPALIVTQKFLTASLVQSFLLCPDTTI